MARGDKVFRKADAILAADIHLREDPPTCRTDDFHAAMWRKLEAIQALQRKHGGIPVLVAGDVFHKWKAPPWLLREAIERIYRWIAIAGQHDLPQHSLAQYPQSALAVLEAAGKVRVLLQDSALVDKIGIWGFPWGVQVDRIGTWWDSNIALVHKLIYQGKEPFPGAAKSGSTAKALIKQMAGFDLIITGDNHQTFTEEYNGQLLVNPGSMMRTTAIQADHEPCVFLWYAADNTVEKVVLPHEKGVVSREHLDIKEQHEERISAFVERLGGTVDFHLSFQDNLRRIMDENEIAEEVRATIEEVLEKCL